MRGNYDRVRRSPKSPLKTALCELIGRFAAATGSGSTLHVSSPASSSATANGQALPIDGKIALRPPKSDTKDNAERDRQTVRDHNDRRKLRPVK
jgi:hypothetical protein